jgi:hypothetical protein
VKRINERLKSKRGLADIARDTEEMRAAATRIPSLFPAGASRALADESEKLAGAAHTEQEPAISAQFLTRVCSGCHDVFREKR